MKLRFFSPDGVELSARKTEAEKWYMKMTQCAQDVAERKDRVKLGTCRITDGIELSARETTWSRLHARWGRKIKFMKRIQPIQSMLVISYVDIA